MFETSMARPRPRSGQVPPPPGMRELDTRNQKSEGEVAFFSAKRWDRRNRADLIESTTSCRDAQVVRSYQVSNPLRLTVLASK